MAKATGVGAVVNAAKDETRYTSVTALTGLLPKNLVWWAGNAVAKCAFDEQDEWRHLETREGRYEYVRRAHQRIKDTAADLGTQIHQLVEAHSLGTRPPTWPLPVRRKMLAFEQFLADYKPVIEAAETKVYSRQYGFAGTCDLIATIDGEMAVLDVKSGKQVWPEAALQVAGYGRSEFLVADPNHPGAVQVTPGRGRRYYTWSGPPEDEIPLPPVTAGYVLHLKDDGYELHKTADLDELFEMFKALLPIDNWERHLKKAALEIVKPGVI